ncbi:MAG TPA: MBL fold metallo-hydrolase [Vicinamibacterales bacterium]|nr:MBL fold metallo-hydrolase [Vicinamibacterales bacterium]
MPAQVVATLPRTWLFVIVLLALALVAPSVRIAAQQGPPSGQIQVLPVRGNIYVLQGAGANITVSIGRDGVLMVDSGLASTGEQVLAAIRRLQNESDLRDKPPGWGAETRSSVADRNIERPAKPIRYIINTHVHPDHVGANELLRRSGMTFTGGNVAGNISDAGEGAAIMAHEAVLVRMTSTTGGAPPAPADAQPTDTYYTDTMKLSHFFNGEGVQLIHQPAAHTDGDTLVWFRGSDVIAAGGVFSTTTYPVIDVKQGGSINGVVEGLNRILRYSIAEFRTEGGTLVIPGHGRLSDSADVAYYRDMVTILRDRVSAMVGRGLTLEQVKAEKPTADYEPRYGATSGPWTTDQFIEAAYTSLGGGKAAAPKTTPGRSK